MIDNLLRFDNILFIFFWKFADLVSTMSNIFCSSAFVAKFLSLIWWLFYVLLIVWFQCKCLCLLGTIIKNLLTYLELRDKIARLISHLSLSHTSPAAIQNNIQNLFQI